MNLWQRRAAGGLVALVGVVFLVSVVVNDLFSVGPAFERMSDGFRPVMQEQTIGALQQDLTGFEAVTQEFQSAVPTLSGALGLSPDEFSSMLQQQFGDVATGMQQLPTIVGSFRGVVGVLDAERDRFSSADEIPTGSLPATTIPWGLAVAGVVLLGLGVAIVALPGRGIAIIAAVVGGLLVVVPIVISLPSKASAADTMNDHLKPVYTAELIAGANQSLATVGAMGTQLQQEMLPALAQQLGMDDAALQSFLQDNLPATAGALQAMPDAMTRFTNVVGAFDAHLDDYDTLKAVAFVPIVWTIIIGGVVALLGALWALVGRRARSSVPALAEAPRELAFKA